MSTPDSGQPQYLPPVPPSNSPQPGYSMPHYGTPYTAPISGDPGPGEPFDGAFDPNDLSRPLYGATFSQSIKRFFKQYANFTGRASRSEFWWATLFMFLVQLIPLILVLIGGISATIWATVNAAANVDGSASAMAREAGDLFMLAPTISLLIIGGSLMMLISLALLVPQLALYWRRLHDVNLAGPFYFLSLLAIGSLVVFIFTLLPPRPQGRRFQSSRV